MVILKLMEDNLDELVNRAIDVIVSGGIVAYPTETFYGLGVRFDNDDSLKRLYEIKKRPIEKAMPLIIGDISWLSYIVDNEWLRSIPEEVERLMKTFWPGPLTLLMPVRSGLSDFITAEDRTVAVRIPGDSFALHLARKIGLPITATSANISGMPPADDAEQVLEYFMTSLDLLIDGGKTPGGLPSTIVDASGNVLRVVRQGAVKLDLPQG